MFVVVLAVFAEPLYRSHQVPLNGVATLILLGIAAVSVGVVTGTGWITYTTGRLLRRFARRPVGLLAGRRMMADPWAGTRTLAAMLVALIIGTVSAGLASETRLPGRCWRRSSQRWRWRRRWA